MGNDDSPDTAMSVDEYVQRLLDAAPPLSAEQRDRLAVILWGGSGARTDEPATDG